MIKNIVWNTTRTLSDIQEGHRKHVFVYLAYIFIFIPVCQPGKNAQTSNNALISSAIFWLNDCQKTNLGEPRKCELKPKHVRV